MKPFLFAATALCVAACQAVPAKAPVTTVSNDDVSVMVIGTYHFVASTSDVVSLEVDDVRNPKSQGELEAIANAVAEFEPTHVVVERETEAPDYIDAKYNDYGPGMLKATANERVQLGYRIANVAGLGIVHGIDEYTSEGEPDYFPFGKVQAHAEATGQGEAFEALISDFRTRAEAAMEETAGAPIAERLIEMNEGPLSRPDINYQFTKFDKGENQPGAELQAYWFMRNAKIFSKIEGVTAPGDRVVVVYGAGHKFWLEHMVEQTPGFVSVDPVDFLEVALSE